MTTAYLHTSAFRFMFARHDHLKNFTKSLFQLDDEH